jgi:pilus assembly protein CpaB
MRRGRTLIFILLIVVIGVVVAAVAFRTFLQPATPQAPANVLVYTVGQNIPQGTKITEDLLTTITLPQSMVPPVAYTVDRKAELLTKIAKYPLDQGVIITSSMVADSSQGVTIAGPQFATWASLIPPGMTAITIPTSRLSLVGYGVNDGAHVNVNACFMFVDVDPSFQSALPNKFIPLTGVTTGPNITIGEGDLKENLIGRAELDPSFQQPFYLIPNEPQRGRITCQAIFQNVIVMKLGNFQLAATDSAAAQAAQQQQSPNAATAPDIVTLIVSPQDAVTLSYLVYTDAKIMMTLRNPSDDSRMATEAATLQFLLSQYNIPVPAKLPYALEPRIDALTAPSLPGDAVTVQPKQ